MSIGSRHLWISITSQSLKLLMNLKSQKVHLLVSPSLLNRQFPLARSSVQYRDLILECQTSAQFLPPKLTLLLTQTLKPMFILQSAHLFIVFFYTPHTKSIVITLILYPPPPLPLYLFVITLLIRLLPPPQISTTILSKEPCQNLQVF